MKRILLLLIILLVAREPLKAQSTVIEPNVVQGKDCEIHAAMFDIFANILRDTDERLFIVARLGKGEGSSEFNRRRLYNVRTYFKEGWPNIDAKRFVFAEGDRYDGEGRVEYYIGSKLMLITSLKRGRDICVDCCNEPDPRYYGMGKTDKSKRRNR